MDSSFNEDDLIPSIHLARNKEQVYLDMPVGRDK